MAYHRVILGPPLVLHAGTKVKIEKEKKEFVRIYFSDGKIGWINKREAGVV
ncbi:MAG: hypothetical protein JRG68_04405 [Deltaproteobacteria bacterium]|nr:hypothetical protein [Deltaproteobacteria bacterium]MBW2011179.1 hypothetical protein [Deltaproteobacteria bacterium]MBW2099996.1 hypothetical protein [Deltaproteobacteria bacterium]